MIDWKDVTPYRKGERGNIAPTAFSIEVSGATLWLSCGHIDYPNQWVVRFGGGIRQPQEIAPTETTTEAEAKRQAINFAWHKACRTTSKWEEVRDQLHIMVRATP